MGDNIMTSLFTGFTAQDFDAYCPHKWSSNAFTLERMAVKQKFQGLGAQLSQTLGAILEESAVSLSDEFPHMSNGKKVDAQWLYIARNTARAQEVSRYIEKTELKADKIFQNFIQDKHLMLGAKLSQEGFIYGLFLHHTALVDAKNLAKKIPHSWQQEAFCQILCNIDVGLHITIADKHYLAAELTEELRQELCETIKHQPVDLFIGHRLTPQETIDKSATLASSVLDTCAQLVPLYQFIFWSKDNDFLGASEKIQKEKANQRKNQTFYKVGDKVRIHSGLLASQQGVVQSIDNKGELKIQVGLMSVTLSPEQVTTTP